jgi:hypothetical protein
MGEIADLMIEGEICEGCGCELGGEAPGYPRRCSGCGGKTDEDHDLIGGYRAMNDRSKSRRQSNRDNAPAILKEAGIEFSSHNDGAHLIVSGKTESFDFWPGTGRWRVRHTRLEDALKRQFASFGIVNLITRIKKGGK